MVNTKSSRDVNMNFTYEIKNEYIVEHLNIKCSELWYIPYLLKDISQMSMNKRLTQSFIRTKNWLIENHPEVLI